MPEISRFFGIVIGMFWEINASHHLPHFHARYQGEQASFTLNPVELIAGSIPRKQRRLVETWAEMHREELMKNWDLLIAGDNPNPIIPLG